MDKSRLDAFSDVVIITVMVPELSVPEQARVWKVTHRFGPGLT